MNLRDRIATNESLGSETLGRPAETEPPILADRHSEDSAVRGSSRTTSESTRDPSTAATSSA